MLVDDFTFFEVGDLIPGVAQFLKNLLSRLPEFRGGLPWYERLAVELEGRGDLPKPAVDRMV